MVLVVVIVGPRGCGFGDDWIVTAPEARGQVPPGVLPTVAAAAVAYLPWRIRRLGGKRVRLRYATDAGPPMGTS